MRSSPSWLLAFAMLALCVLAGALLVAPTNARLQAIETQRAIDAGTISTTSAEAQEATRAEQAAVDFRQLAVNFAVVIALLMLVLLLESVLLNLFAMISGGRGQFSIAWSVVLHVAAWSLGIYLLINGLLICLSGAGSFSTFSELNRVTPSVLFLAPANVTGFWSGFLGSLNPFTAWAFARFIILLKPSMGIEKRWPRFAFATVATLAGAILQGLSAMGS